MWISRSFGSENFSRAFNCHDAWGKCFLGNMNACATEFAKWYVRIIDPKVNEYTFQARNEKVNAQKMSALLFRVIRPNT